MIPPWLEMAKYVDLDTATHVAGPCVAVAGRHIQRCCVCGLKLSDDADKRVRFKFWGEGELVKEKGGILRSTGREMDSINRKLPIDLCVELVEV